MGEEGDGEGCLIILLFILVGIGYLVYIYSVPPIGRNEAIAAYKAGQKYVLMIVPAGGDPVELSRHSNSETCMMEQKYHIQEAFRQRLPVLSLKCVPILPWWRVLIK